MKFLPKIVKNKFPMRLGIVGLSHLGIVWSAAFARLGIKVYGFDTDKNIIDSLCKGKVTISEPGIQEIYDKFRSNLSFSTNSRSLTVCDIVIFAKDMPYDEEGVIDPTEINKLLGKVFPVLKQNAEFVFMCQVPAGFTRNLKRKIDKKFPACRINLVYCLQTITIGTSLEWFDNPDKVVFGLQDSKILPGNKLIDLYSHFNCPLEFVSYESAEMTKAAISLSLACSVTFVNAISDLCEKIGADINEVVKVMKMDKRFSPLGYWRPGLGFAGGHLERDLNTLMKLSVQNNLKGEFVKSIMTQSKQRFNWLTNILDENILAINKKTTICIWGLAYKKGTDSTHNAHCLRVIRNYKKKYKITVYDPLARLPLKYSNVQQYDNKLDALRNAECVVILTEWDEFAINNPEIFSSMKKKIIIDCVNIIGKDVRNNKNLKYFGMGSPLSLIKKNQP